MDTNAQVKNTNLAADDSNETTDTFHWDTAFAVKIKDVNEAIKNKKSSPAVMQQAIDGGAIVNCSFGDWEVGSTGDGSLLHLNIPVKTCTVSFHGKTSPAINNITAIAEVQLYFYDAEVEAKEKADADAKAKTENATGTFKDLKVKSHKDDGGGDIVSGVSMDYGDQNVGMVIQGILPEGIKEWLNNNIQVFDHIFATVNLNKTADTGAYEWLYPTKTGYAFISNDNNPDDSMLGILCMTEKRDADNLVDELAHNAIPSTSDAGFLISEGRLIKKMILPTLPHAFKGLAETDFQISADGKSIDLVSTDKAFTITHDGKTYSANLEALTLSLKSKQLTLHAETKTEITPEIYSHSVSDHAYEISLYTKSDGTQSLKYNEVGKPNVVNWTSQDSGVTIAEIIAGIIAGIILAILIVLTDGLILIAVVIIGGLLTGLVSVASEIIQLVGTDDAPDISLLVMNCTDPIQWTDQKDFTLNVACLNGPLQLGGFFKS